MKLILGLVLLANVASAKGFQCKEDMRDTGGVLRVVTVAERSGKYKISSVSVTDNRTGREREEIELLDSGDCSFAKNELYVAYCRSELGDVSISKNNGSVLIRSEAKTFSFAQKDCYPF